MSKFARELQIRERNTNLAIEVMGAIEKAVCEARTNGTIEMPQTPEQATAQVECVVSIYCQLEHVDTQPRQRV